MAKDVTVRVTGTNADGSINVQVPEGASGIEKISP